MPLLRKRGERHQDYYYLSEQITILDIIIKSERL
jgi:hypothetical protein